MGVKRKNIQKILRRGIKKDILRSKLSTDLSQDFGAK